MLEEIDASQLSEWMAYDKIQHDEVKRDQLATQATAGVKNHKRGRR